MENAAVHASLPDSSSTARAGGNRDFCLTGRWRSGKVVTSAGGKPQSHQNTLQLVTLACLNYEVPPSRGRGDHCSLRMRAPCARQLALRRKLDRNHIAASPPFRLFLFYSAKFCLISPKLSKGTFYPKYFVSGICWTGQSTAFPGKFPLYVTPSLHALQILNAIKTHY